MVALLVIGRTGWVGAGAKEILRCTIQPAQDVCNINIGITWRGSVKNM